MVSYQLWSGGDYQHNTQQIAHGSSELVLSDNATNGDYSIHLVRIESDDNSFIRIPLDVEIGDTITFSVDIYTPNNEMTIEIFDGSYFTVNVAQNTYFHQYSITKTITTSADVRCIIQIKKAVDCYVDNIQVTLQ